MKFGKNLPRQDPRTLQLRGLLPPRLPEPPPEYDVDIDGGCWPLPLPDFGNLEWGDCVIAARANQTMRFEMLEQGELVEPTLEEVLREYWAEQGDPEGTEKPDNGLFLMDSLNRWRRDGWTVGGKRYNIHAFAKVNHHYQREIMLGVTLLTGLYTGAMLSQSAIDQLDRGEIWAVVEDDGGIVGGHCMYMIGYTRTGPVYLTWGQRQVATWDWALRYMDECYGVVDDKDKFVQDSPVDAELLESYLGLVTGGGQ